MEVLTGFNVQMRRRRRENGGGGGEDGKRCKMKS